MEGVRRSEEQAVEDTDDGGRDNGGRCLSDCVCLSAFPLCPLTGLMFQFGGSSRAWTSTRPLGVVYIIMAMKGVNHWGLCTSSWP